jgi:hypothetical protein
MTPDEAVAGASHYSTSPLSPILYGPREGNWTQRDVCLRSPPFCRGHHHPAKLSSFVHHAAAFLCPYPQYDQGKHTKVQHRVTHPSPSHTQHMTCTNNQSHNDMSLSLSLGLPPQDDRHEATSAMNTLTLLSSLWVCFLGSGGLPRFRRCRVGVTSLFVVRPCSWLKSMESFSFFGNKNRRGTLLFFVRCLFC